MRPGYVVLLWDPESAHAAACAGRVDRELAACGLLRQPWDAPGAAIHVDASRSLPVRLDAGSLVLRVGSVFDREDATSLPARSRGAAHAGFAKTLCREAWGAYVAVEPDGRGRGRVFRSPSGALDALTWRTGPIAVVAEDLAGLPSCLWPPDIALDWDAIADTLVRPAAVAGRTALAGVHAVAPGDLQDVGGSAATAIWRPADWTRDLEDGPSAVWEDRLRRCAEAVVAAEVSEEAALVAEASGGFDSSVVTALAGRAGGGRLATAVNLHASQPGADERPWARALCAHLDVPLAEVAWRLEPLTAADLERFAGGARPAMNALDPWLDARLTEVVREVGATGLLTGYGGDAVFFQMPSATPLADRRQAVGSRALLEPLARHFGRWRRRSVWSVWAEALSGRVEPPPAPLLGPRALAMPPKAAAHPWLEDLDGAPPAKQLQVRHLAAGQSSYGPALRTRAARLVQPLLAQPMLELCLSIPSWRLIEGGRDRALARRAFADLLPPAVVERRSKGAAAGYYAQVIAASLDVLRPHLLDGVLAGNGVLDRGALEAALTPQSLFMRGQAVSLLQAAAVESWVRWWQTRIPDAVARTRHGVGMRD